MSTTVTYKGATLATVDNATVTLETAGKYCEDDFTLTDVSGGGGVQTANISVDSSDILYYTDGNMTVQSAQYLDGVPAALGTLVVVHNSGPTSPVPPEGVTQLAEYSYRNDTCIVYKVTG